MFYLRGEGEVIRNGFNFYPWSDRKYSVGFILRLGRYQWRCRFAVKTKKLHCYLIKDGWTYQ